ncbi:MAG TPA: hypothetical protein VHY58_20730 [Streptosporangiaceae bacterium]|jgi:hypothetical protein|nr:hypothetical protein [Streptosporangiaceae bacterium]
MPAFLEEHKPQLSGVEGTVSYTLVYLGQDEITSLGVFMSQESAQRANEPAVTWAKQRLADLGAAPPEAHDGDVLTHTTFG